MGSGFLINYYKSKQNVAGPVEKNEELASAVSEKLVKMIKVDVSGAVERPGIYELPYDSRTEDVLIAAGGLGAKADRIYVSKNINLAQRVTDGMKVYIPVLGEVVSSAVGQVMGVSDGAGEMININSASTDELDKLPGVGAVTAGKIIDGRPYRKIEDLLERKVVGKSVFEKIKGRITL